MAKAVRHVSARDYALAIGTTILSFNEMEAELYGLIFALLGTKKQTENIEAEVFGTKVNHLADIAAHQTDLVLRERLVEIVTRARALNDRRKDLAHGILWFDPFEGRAQRRFVHFEGKKPDRTVKIDHDDSTPEEILDTAAQFDEFGNQMGALATEIRQSLLQT
jgi:hypothetical protein